MKSVFNFHIQICLGILLSFGSLEAQNRVASDYKVQPEDVLRITVLFEPSLTQEGARVSATGNITFTLLEEIPVAEKTVEEIQKEIERRLRDGYIKDPRVQVHVLQYNEQFYTIMGEVMIDGIYPLPP